MGVVELLSLDERVTLEQAIESYTLNSAYASHLDDRGGSLVVGKSADLVVLDRDLFKIPANEIAKTQVLLTLFAGQAVHGELAALSGTAGRVTGAPPPVGGGGALVHNPPFRLPPFRALSCKSPKTPSH